MTTQSACCDGCASAQDDTAAAIACTLSAGDFKARAADIRRLARRSLLSSRREPLRLELIYAADSFAEVEDLVAKETACCAFLGFDLRRDATGVSLTITAPPAAAAAADELFAHFAPELAEAAT